MRNQRLLSAALAAVCLLGLALPAAAEPFFPKTNTYTPGQFPDVALSAWYTPSVARAYELGLMQGNPSGTFCPGGSVTLAETATLAARLYKLYRGDDSAFAVTTPWYDAYVDFSRENGMLTGDYEDYNAPAKRREFAAILAHALPAEALETINDVADGNIPDVPAEAEHAAEIYSLYRAGVLTGNDAKGTFAPDSDIRRSEVAAIAVRLADPEMRLRPGAEPTYPDLPECEPAADGYFADAAMLGNSLVQGMSLYSDLNKPMAFYCKESLTVYSILSGGYVANLCSRPYGKVYIELGINEVFIETEKFIEGYGKVIDTIRAALPEAEIYVMSLTPVTADKSKAGFSLKTIRTMNEALHALAEEKECWYLDCFTPLCGSDGYLAEAYAASWDGAHLSTKGYNAWADVIRSHYAPARGA